MENLKFGAAAPKLWCVEVVPKRRRLSRNDELKIRELAKGMPSDPWKALEWAVMMAEGLSDQRTATFVRDRQRLVVFRVKKRAAERARRETNEDWSGKVREVRVV